VTARGRRAHFNVDLIQADNGSEFQAGFHL